MRRIRILRFGPDGAREVEDWVAEEGLLELSVASWGKYRFAITPDDVRAFVYGHLLGAGLIRDPGDVLSFREELDHRVGTPGEVIRVAVSLRRPPRVSSPEEIIWSACGEATQTEGSGLLPLRPRPLISAEALLGIPRLVAGEAEDFRLTGAYHYAFLLAPEPRILMRAKDIGRHNAVDKALGEALLSGVNLGGTILYTTGRITAEIALKALRAGVPLVCSRGAALLGAIALARRYNLGLVGFLRGRRFNLYCGEGWLRLR